MIATFCGHREISNRLNISLSIQAVVKQLLEEGVREFNLGGYGEFDILAAYTLKKFKHEYPDIGRTIVIPYMDRDYDKNLYDQSLYPPLEDVPLRFAISRRNKWMVDSADIVLAYVTHDWGGAYATLEYAKRSNKRIISINEVLNVH